MSIDCLLCIVSFLSGSVYYHVLVFYIYLIFEQWCQIMHAIENSESHSEIVQNARSFSITKEVRSIS